MAVIIVGEASALGAVVVEQVPQALPARLSLQAFHALARTPARGAVVRFGQQLRLMRIDVLRHEGGELFAQLLRARREIGEHQRGPCPIFSRLT